jgi:arginyl-tRNA synthetase
MKDIRLQWRGIVYAAVRQLAEELGVTSFSAAPDDILIQKPPKPEMGDIAVPFFSFAKLFRMAPQKIAEAVAEKIKDMSEAPSGEITVAGPYINITTDLVSVADTLYQELFTDGDDFGKTDAYAGRNVMIEFSCPNTNKPLHLGHLRNDALGESVSRILKANGAEVRKVNLINDRGIHICKSMLAYQRFGNGETPESTGIKSDHFVGDYYVKFAQWAKEDPSAEEQAQQMLKKWEAHDPELMALWEKMNGWTISGIQETYDTTGISFDSVYYESKTYTRGKKEVLKGLEQGAFYKESDGSVWVDLEPINLDKKVLLRKDGTSLYLTQDIGTAIARHDDWPFDTLIYVVASEQKYHFTVLFYVLSQLGFSWADRLYHLSYGMVNLPDGKMKSREGTVVDADDLFKELQEMARAEIVSKGREKEVGDVDATSAAIALGALNYYLLQVNPVKDMVFDPKESISFNGNTGPYLQYMGARISSMLRKFDERKGEFLEIEPDFSYISEDIERELIKLMSSFPDVVREAGKDMNPSVIAGYLYDLTKSFSRYYHDVPILHDDNKKRVLARIELVQAILQVLKNGYFLIGIPFLDRM